MTQPDTNIGNQMTDADAALWMLQGKTPEARQAFMANWLRGTIHIPREVKLRIWLSENDYRGREPGLNTPIPDKEDVCR